ncbi:MAG: TonB-dependent receptor [Acidobacteriota bacterium]|nr:TonB-dependent receptor [Acidobacteriota bacterium]
MTQRAIRKVLALAVIGLALLPGAALAQSAISGRATDNTSAVLAGVTAEATSPVLIEGAKVVVTDGQGRYSVIDLRPGTYRVTFTLAGFTTVVREGIVLTAGFTAPVDVQLSIGALEESVTVSGASPVVDVQSARTQQVLTRELLDSVPTGRSLWAYGQTVPSIAMGAADVGGSRGVQYIAMSAHGSYHADNAHTIDGMSIKSLEANGQWTAYHNTGMFEEISYETTGSGADTSGAGVGIRLVPKEGGNIFSGQAFLSNIPGDWGSSNESPELIARGLQKAGQVHRIFDYNGTLGGPIRRDRLWFFGSVRYWGADTFLNNSFYNLDSTRRTYVPDLNQQSLDDNTLKSGMTRLTLQMSPRHKFAAYLDRTSKWRGGEGGPLDAHESTSVRYPRNYYTAQAKYTGTLTNRLLVEGGMAISHWTWSHGDRQPYVDPTDIPRVDRSLGTEWGAPDSAARYRKGPRYVLGAWASYVTGTHRFKTGFSWDFGTAESTSVLGQSGVVDLVQEYRLGRPESVNVFNTPLYFANRLNHDLALYAQDSWTIDRLTLSPGVRVEWINAEIRPQLVGAGRFVPAREFAREECMPCWGPDVSPRVAATYDLFGNGKTALKTSVGKYMRSEATIFAETYNPMRIQTDRRTWTDLNGDDIAQNNEIGAVNAPFDLVGVRTRNPDPDIKRSYQWEFSAGVQRELIPRVSVSANWVRRTFRQLTWRENLLVSQSDYTPITIQSPINPSETIQVYSISPLKLGRVNELDRNSEKNRRFNNGFDANINARVGRGTVFGGASWDRQIRIECEQADPNNLRFCDQSDFGMPYRTMFKAAGMYPLPYGFEISGSFQSYPGGSQQVDDNEPWLDVDYNVTRTILPALVQSSVTIPLIQPGTKFLPRLNQLDVRFSRVFRVGQVRLRGQFDVFNATNSSSILDQGETFGPALDRVNQILPGRILGLSMRVDF